MNNILVIGASGQLGQCFKHLATKNNKTEFHFFSSSDVNILNLDNIIDVFRRYQPLYVLNCAAYTAVDKAEDEHETAFKINKIGVENLSNACLLNNVVLIHISTDFVFSGNKAKPLNESDETNPISVYGGTKLDGEKVVEALLTKFFIIRTGWLYSEFGNNFLKTMLRLGKERDEIKIISDQVGTPTYAIDLASCVFKIIESGSAAYGVYHYSNEGVTSWYDFAKAIFEISGIQIKTLPIKTEEYITKARRPAYSVLDKSKIKTELNMEIPYWRDSLTTCISKIKN